MTINKHINQLLYTYDCVIIPDFGGFVTRYYPAEIQEGTYMFRPPSKRISFNERLKENDGLLAHYLSKQEGITYQEALQSIEISVRSWRRILESGNKITLEGVGKMYANAEGKIQFSPALDVNFLTSSYGLTIFRSPAISEDSMLTQNITNSAERSIKNLETRDKVYYSNAFSGIFRAALVLVPFGTVVFLALDSSKIFNSDSSKSSSAIMPGIELIQETLYTKNTIEEELPKSETQFVEEKDNAVEEAPKEIKRAEPVEVKEAVLAPVESPNTKITNSLAPFQIIVGAFVIEENAKALTQSLINAGFEAHILPKEGNFYKVSAGGFSSQNEARETLNRAKAEVNAEAWVRKM